MVKAAISGYYGFKNFGDETILSILIDHLKQLGVDVTVFSSDTDFTSKAYNVNSVGSFDIKNVIKRIKETDFLISGGGSLLQDVTSLKSLVYYSFIITMALFFNKKVIIFAQGIGPLNSKLAQIIVKNILKHCSLVTVRDEQSLNLLSKWNINAKLVCDPVFSLNTSAQQTISNKIGIQLRDFKTLNYNLLQKLALFIIEKFPEKEIEIFSLQQNQDLEICTKFKNMLNSFNPNIKTEIVTEDIINRISKLEILIAMRFHAILTALKFGVKTCAINYDIKVEKLAKNAQIPIISMDASENMENIYQQIKKLNKNELLSFCETKTFDWSEFDKLFLLSAAK